MFGDFSSNKRSSSTAVPHSDFFVVLEHDEFRGCTICSTKFVYLILQIVEPESKTLRSL